ncbi:non-ribosomal peptide synthetase [Actinophytocola sediminis]
MTGQDHVRNHVRNHVRTAVAAAPSFAQERLWVTDQVGPGGAGHHLTFAAELDGPLDQGALRSAFDTIAARHETLRTCLAVHDGTLHQLIVPEARIPLTVTEPVPPEDVPRRLAEEAARPFALDRPPLLRVTLLPVTEHRQVLLVTVHHIAADAWSRPVLVRELATAYVAVRGGRPTELPDLPLQYADHAAWQRDLLDRGAFDPGFAYWRERLSGAPELALLPDHRRPARRSHRGAALSFDLDPELAGRLRRLAANHGVSTFMVLLTGFLVVLARWTGQTDLVVGTAVANRRRRETHGLIGFFVNLLALRVDVAGASRFRDWLDRVALACREAYDHQEVPFERLVDKLAPDRDLSRHPLFQVVFQLVDATGAELALDGLEARPLPVDDATAPFDLLCTVFDRGGALTAELRYATDLWERESVDRLRAAWLTALAAIESDVDGSVDGFVPLSTVDREFLAGANRTERALPEPATVAHLVRRQLAHRADRTALTDHTGEWTYALLVASADRLAGALRTAGVGTDEPVGILLHRSAALVTAMLGVLTAGGGYVVLDPAYPPARLALMVRDLDLRAVVHAGDPPSWLRDTGVPTVPLDAVGDAGDAGEPDAGHPDGLVTVVLTSGSTGRPKGVAVPNRAVVRLVTATEYVDLGPGDVLVHLGDPSFDITTFEVWGALCNGARVHVLPGDEPLGPDEVLAVLRDVRPTVLCLTATLFNQVVATDPAAFAALRHLFVVGEVMDQERTRTVLDHGAPGVLHNGYGPTENTTFSACHRIGDLPAGAPSVPIGTPITNTTAYVLDERMRPVPVGVPGELYVGGAGLARGYVNRPGPTAERFVPDPFGSAGGRLYRTGDLVRWNHAGVLEFLGRRDHQVKLRGHRIEPGEVASALRGCAGVHDCAVRLVEVDGDRRLVGYVVPVAGHALDAAVLLAELRSTLPPFLVPNHLVEVAALPTTTSGKLDAARLPGVGASLPVPGQEARAPRTSTERELWRIWADALRVAHFGVHDDFFALGGHSLLATVVVTAVRDRFAVDLPLRGVFDAPTVAALAAEIDLRRARRAGPDGLDELVAELKRLGTQGGVSP